mgnify:CR=1 FL=1|jgi:hypothetical protein|eukprot:29049-Pelagococcus_subviridis.AAC.6
MRALRVARTLARAAVAVAPPRVAPTTPARSPVAAMASRAAKTASSSASLDPSQSSVMSPIPRAPSDGATKTQLLVVTTPALMSSNPLARLRGDDDAMPSDRFDIHVGVELGDFPRDVLEAREGPPVAVLWWFGDAKVRPFDTGPHTTPFAW